MLLLPGCCQAAAAAEARCFDANPAQAPSAAPTHHEDNADGARHRHQHVGKVFGAAADGAKHRGERRVGGEQRSTCLGWNEAFRAGAVGEVLGGGLWVHVAPREQRPAACRHSKGSLPSVLQTSLRAARAGTAGTAACSPPRARASASHLRAYPMAADCMPVSIDTAASIPNGEVRHLGVVMSPRVGKQEFPPKRRARRACKQPGDTLRSAPHPPVRDVFSLKPSPRGRAYPSRYPKECSRMTGVQAARPLARSTSATCATGTAHSTTVRARAMRGSTGRTKSTCRHSSASVGGEEVGVAAARHPPRPRQRRALHIVPSVALDMAPLVVPSTSTHHPNLPPSNPPTCFLNSSLASRPSTVGSSTSCTVDLNSACGVVVVVRKGARYKM